MPRLPRINNRFMATYIYESIPASPDQPKQNFEIQQSMREAALTHHPESGVPIRRVITGGYGLISRDAAPPPPQHSCGGGCCCHN